MLQNEPGALFIQCSLFLFLLRICYPAPGFELIEVSPMTLHDSVRDRLRAIEALLRETEHWQETAPDSSAFASDKPFCLDTLEPLEWLQWVLIPRMHQLLESGQPLPQNFAVAPYYEMALDQAHPVRESMLAELLLLDALFAGEQA